MGKENLDNWVEVSSGIKFLCWGELKPSITNPDDAVIVNKGDKIQGIIMKIEPKMIKRDDGDEEIDSYMWYLKMKDYDEQVLVWANSSMMKRIDRFAEENIVFEVGDEVELHYVKDYKAKNNKMGREVNIRIRKHK
jgi:hypothetical protein